MLALLVAFMVFGVFLVLIVNQSLKRRQVPGGDVTASRRRAPPARPPTPPAIPPSSSALPRPSRSVLVRHEATTPQTTRTRPATRPSTGRPSRLAFVGHGQRIVVAGRSIEHPFTYLGPSHTDEEASAIDPSLRVGDGRYAHDLPYWPTYAQASPEQRARYLDWFVSGRSDPAVPIGYVFIYFCGLERALLLDRVDVVACTAEVERLWSIYGPTNRSFDGYARHLLAFVYASFSTTFPEPDIVAHLARLGNIEHAMDAILAWYHRHEQPLPPEFGQMVAASMEGAKRSVVLERAGEEFRELFAARYRGAFGDGIRLVAGKHPRKLQYRAASPSLLRYHIDLSIPDVRRRSAQFKPLVKIWNGCLDDLRTLSRKRHGQEGHLTAEMWEVLPPELRSEVDHPDLDRWTRLVAEAPTVRGVHLLDHAALLPLVGLEPKDKVTAAQAKKIAERAELVGYGLEPDARLVSRGVSREDAVALWRHHGHASVDKGTYLAARNLLTLLLQVATADGSADEEELEMVEKLLEESFGLDEVMRKRLVALRETLLHGKTRGTAIAKKIRETRTPRQVEAVGEMLVSIAAADGVLDPAEHKELQSLFRSLGLSATFLDSALVRANLRVDSRRVQRAGSPSQSQGEVIVTPSRVQLDPARLARLQAETAEVARILADVLDSEEDETSTAPEVPEAAQPRHVETAPPVVASQSPWARLDQRYHALVVQLGEKQEWSPAEATALAKQYRLMPDAVVEIVNEWAEDAHGDVLIEEADGWRINPTISEALHP